MKRAQTAYLAARARGFTHRQAIDLAHATMQRASIKTRRALSDWARAENAAYAQSLIATELDAVRVDP